MANMGKGVGALIAMLILLILEAILFPIAAIFIAMYNSTASPPLTTAQQQMLAVIPNLFIAIIIITVVGGFIAAAYMAIKG